MGAKTWGIAGLLGVSLVFGAAPAIAQGYGPTPEPDESGEIVDTTQEPDVLGVEIVAPAPVAVMPTATAQTAPESSSTLPVTGGDVLGFVLFGAGAIAAGTALTRANRRTA